MRFSKLFVFDLGPAKCTEITRPPQARSDTVSVRAMYQFPTTTTCRDQCRVLVTCFSGASLERALRALLQKKRRTGSGAQRPGFQVFYLLRVAGVFGISRMGAGKLPTLI